MGETSTTINYSYDPLYRLTGTDYSTGDYYHYACDVVGNRSQQGSTVSSLQSTVNYQYDIANRLSNVDNVNYTWDANGNLLNDGTSTYTYDAANRMTGVTQGSNTYTYAYRCNGLSSDQWGITGCESDRESQIVNGVTTNYVLDQAAGLTLRLEKRGEEYTFMYKHDPQEAWTVLAPQEFAGTPQYVGLLARSWDTGSEDLNADWSYFRLESWAEEEQQMRVLQPQNSVPNGPEAVPTQNVTPTPTLAPTPVITITPTPVRTATATPSRTPVETPHSGLIPQGDPQPEANLVLARYNQPSIPHMGMASLNQETVSQTIDYTYDPLGRLTAADYSTGDYYHYSYDEVGNRLSQDSSAANQETTTHYTYDIANRMTQAGNTAYSWDDNGNLLDDGLNTYTYDPANRLAAVSNQQSAFSFQYNGLGDRLQQTVNSQTTNYTLDLNAGLTQVLDDGTDTYLYGVDRIAQIGGSVLSQQRYMPFGEVRTEPISDLRFWIGGEARRP